MYDFMKGIKERGYYVDWINFHWYLYDDLSIDDFKSFIQRVSEYYPGYKVWITEFAGAGDKNADQNKQFWDAAYQIIQEYNWLIERYSWFTNSEGPNDQTEGWDLIDRSNNGQPTTLGYDYRSKPNQ